MGLFILRIQGKVVKEGGSFICCFRVKREYPLAALDHEMKEHEMVKQDCMHDTRLLCYAKLSYCCFCWFWVTAKVLKSRARH